MHVLNFGVIGKNRLKEMYKLFNCKMLLADIHSSLVLHFNLEYLPFKIMHGLIMLICQCLNKQLTSITTLSYQFLKVIFVVRVMAKGNNDMDFNPLPHRSGPQGHI